MSPVALAQPMLVSETAAEIYISNADTLDNAPPVTETRYISNADTLHHVLHTVYSI